MVKNPSSVWRLIDLSYPSAYQNLALEEALARLSVARPSVPIVRFWKNPPSVIVGRFQEVSEEVDVEYCQSTGLAVARRFSGGGAVFHDYGNLNFSVIIPRTIAATMNEIHRKNSSIIIDMLAQNGVKAELVAPNSVHVDGRKISGAAAAVWQGCVLWHASILVSSDLSTLNHALAPSRVPQRTRSIRSRWHPVTTMSEVTENSVDIETVQETLIDCCKETLGSRIEITPLSVGEENAARLLYEGKYSLDDWNWKGRWDAPERFAERDGPHTTIAV